jgi:hypothetical protein
VGYWKDSIPLRYILSRTYGRKILEDETPKPFSAIALTTLGLLAYLIQVLSPVIIIAAILIWWKILTLEELKDFFLGIL